MKKKNCIKCVSLYRYNFKFVLKLKVRNWTVQLGVSVKSPYLSAYSSSFYKIGFLVFRICGTNSIQWNSQFSETWYPPYTYNHIHWYWRDQWVQIFSQTFCSPMKKSWNIKNRLYHMRWGTRSTQVLGWTVM